MSNVNKINKADAKIDLTEEELMDIFLEMGEYMFMDDPYFPDLKRIAVERESGKLEIDFPAIAKEKYLGNKRFEAERIAKEYFDLEGVSEYRVRHLKASIGKLLEDEIAVYKTSLILELRKLKKVSTCDVEYREKKRDFIMKELNIDFIYDDNKCLYENVNVLRSFYRTLSFDIRPLIEDIPLNKDNSFKDIHDIYKRSLNPAIDEKEIDQQLHDAIINLSDRIYEMRQAGTSFGKIQKTLTQECIDSGTIPKKIYRKSRAQGASNEVVEYDTLLPISGIKSVINLKDSEKAATQH